MFNTQSTFGGLQGNTNQNPGFGLVNQQSLQGQQPQNNVIALPDAKNYNAFNANQTPTFANISNQAQGTQGLFGAKPGLQTGGLFGTQSNTTAYGQQQQSSTGTMGFMQNTTLGQPQNNMLSMNKPTGFGGNTQPTTQPGMFGSNTQSNMGTGTGFGGNTGFPTGVGMNNNNATPSPFGLGQQPNNNTQTLNTGGLFGQAKPPSLGFGNANNTGMMNTMNNTNPANPLGNMGGFGGINAMSTGGFGNTGNSLQMNSFGMGQQKQPIGMGQTMGVNMGQSNQGTVGVQYSIKKNAKNNNVHSIRFSSSITNIPRNVLRLQDYTLHKNNQLNNPQVATNFSNYLQGLGGSQGMGMGMGMPNTGTTPMGNLMAMGMSNNQPQNQGQGIFGNTNPTAQSSLYGNQQKPGLFNTQNLLTSNVINTHQNQSFANNQPSGLFNKPTNTPFNNMMQPQMQTGGGLFGTNTQNTNQGGLFQQNTQSQTPSLFGNNTPSLSKPVETNQINLFGNQQQAPSLFGGPSMNTQDNNLNKQTQPLFSNTSGPGLFGNNTQPSTGLFGNNTQPSTGLFGNTSQPNTGTFGNNTQPSTGLFGNNAQPSIGLFGAKQQSPAVNLFGPPSQSIAQPSNIMQPQTTQNVTGFNNTIQLPNLDGLRGPCCIYIIPGQPINQFNEKFGATHFSKPNYEDLMDEFSTFKVKKDYSEQDMYRHANSSFYEPPMQGLQNNIIRNDRYKNASKKLFTRSNGETKNLGTIRFINDNQKKNDDRFEPIQVKSFIRREEEDDGTIRLKILIHKDGQKIEVAEYFKADALVAEIISYLAKKKGLISKDEIKKYKVFKDEHELDNIFSLDEYGLHHGDMVVVAPSVGSFTVTRKVANPEVLPKRSQKYTTKPSFMQLEKMTEEELSAVPDFTVVSEYATLQFEDPVDLRGVDIDKVIKMSHKMVEVYSDSEFSEAKPRIGEKLNKSAFITFNNFNFSKKATSIKFIGKLKELAASMNATVIDVDRKNDTLKIYVGHF